MCCASFIGDELAGEGLQWDHSTSFDGGADLRFSIGAFNDLSGGGHGHVEGEAVEPEIHVEERKSGEDMGFTGRLSASQEIGHHAHL